MSFGGKRQPVRRALLSRGWRHVVPLIKRRDGYQCQVCGARESWHTSPTGKRMPNLVVGHRTPPERYMGSHNDPANLWTLCASCNASQGNRTEAEWRAARSGRLVELGIAGRKTPDPNSSVVVRDYTRKAAPDGMAPENFGGSSPQTAIAPDECADDIGTFKMVEKPR